MINKLKLIRKAQKVVRNTGNPEEAYKIISEAFGREHQTEMLDYNTAKAKLETELSNESNNPSERTD